MATLTGDKNGVIKVEDRSRSGLSGWFSGSSAPVAVGLPTSIMAQDSAPENGDRTPARLKKRSPTATSELSSPLKSTTPTSRFNFFAAPKPQTVQIPATMEDEHLSLSIPDALYPSGQPDFSPAALKNLQQNAEGTLSSLLNAYKSRVLQLHELQSELSAAHEELDEANTRARSLKSQLDEMARKFSEQDAAVEDLVHALAHEKRARAEENEAREKSIRLLRAEAEEKRERDRERGSKHTSTSSISGLSLEDLGIAKSHKWHGSVDLSSADSDAESVFSRSGARSPSLNLSFATASIATVESTPEIAQAAFGRVVQVPPTLTHQYQSQTQSLSQTQNQNQTSHPHQQRPKILQQRSTYQKILGGLAGSDDPSPVSGQGQGSGKEECENCKGQTANVAWDTVSLLKAENKGLKERVERLEGGVEGAIELCRW